MIIALLGLSIWVYMWGQAPKDALLQQAHLAQMKKAKATAKPAKELTATEVDLNSTKGLPTSALKKKKLSPTKDYLESDKMWDSKLAPFLTETLGLSEQKYTQYNELKNAYRKELTANVARITGKILAGKDSQVALKSKAPLGNIQEVYEAKLEQLLGPNNFDQWKDFREAYNKENLRQGKRKIIF